jgi:putative hydrolase of the HAD superfamily
MRLEGVRAVVFDLDDTLYPEREYTLSGVRAVALRLEAELGEGGVFRELAEIEAGDPAGPLYSRWLEQRGLDPEPWLPEILQIHRTHRPRLKLQSLVVEILTSMRAVYRLGMVTDGRMEQQRAKSQALGLHDLLDALVFSDELGRERWKPHPAPYRKALESLGVSPSQAVYVGDNPAKDFLGARRAGMRSIRLRRKGGLHANAEPSGPEAAPDYEVDNFGGLDRLLAR